MKFKTRISCIIISLILMLCIVCISVGCQLEQSATTPLQVEIIGFYSENTSGYATLNGTEILTNKTITSPVFTGVSSNTIDINQGSLDDEILSLRSSDVSTGFADANDWLSFKKSLINNGGAEIIVTSEDVNNYPVMDYQVIGGQAPTTKGTTASALFELNISEQSGGSKSDVTANGIVFAIKPRIGGSNRAKWHIDKDGNVWQDGNIEISGNASISSDLWVQDNVSAENFTDRTPYYQGDAVNELISITSINGQIDHDSLPEFTKVIRTYPVTEERIVLATGEKYKIIIGYETIKERSLGATISMLTVAIKQLNERIEVLENSK